MTASCKLKKVMAERIDTRGSFGSGGPAIGIGSTERVTRQSNAPNMRINPADGSISVATGKGPGGTEVVTHPTAKPTFPLKRQADDMKGTHIDINA